MRAIGIELLDETVQTGFSVRHAGMKGPVEQVRRPGRAAFDAAQDTAAVCEICFHTANGIKSENRKFLIAEKSDGEFFVYITFVNTAKKSFVAVVIFINHIDPRHCVHPVASKRDSCWAAEAGRLPRSTACS